MQQMNPKPKLTLPKPPEAPAANPDPKPEISSEPASNPTSIELQHLESIQIDPAFKTAFPGVAGLESGGMGPDIGAGAIVLTPDQFYEGVFKPCHAMPGAILKLQSLPIRPDEEQSARACSDAIYEIAEETPLFRFLIEPGNIWVQRAFAIGAYAFPKALAVKAEINIRKAQAAQPKPKETEVN